MLIPDNSGRELLQPAGKAKLDGVASSALLKLRSGLAVHLQVSWRMPRPHLPQVKVLIKTITKATQVAIGLRPKSWFVSALASVSAHPPARADALPPEDPGGAAC